MFDVTMVLNLRADEVKLHAEASKSLGPRVESWTMSPESAMWPCTHDFCEPESEESKRRNI